MNDAAAINNMPIDETIVRVRADTRAFADDVAVMKRDMEQALGVGADKAARGIEQALMRAVQTGKFGFEDLRRVALAVLADIAREAIRAGIQSMNQQSGSGSAGGGGGSTASIIGTLMNLGMMIFGGGLPGRATGGPVMGGRAYVVGERGPELFVPTSSGRIDANYANKRGRDMRITINVHGGASGAGGRNDAAGMQASARQIAQAVRRAVDQAED